MIIRLQQQQGRKPSPPPPPPARSKARRIAAAVLYNLGVMGVGIWLWSVVNMTIVPDWQNWSFEQQSRHGQSGVLSYVADRGQQFSEDLQVWLRLAPPPEAPVRIISPAGPQDRRSSEVRIVPAVNTVIGRLRIPRLGIETVVREGDGEQTLLSSLGHIPGTAMPGDRKGNVGVAGHRDTFFRRLEGIRKNDVLKFETDKGGFAYEVVGTRIVKPTDVDVLRPGDSAEMTLVTCYPFRYIGNAPERFIVKARQLPASADDQVASVPASAPERQQPRVSRESEKKATAARTEASPRLERAAEPAPERRMASFSLIKGHTQILAPGVLAGVTDIDPDGERATVWVSVRANRKTQWFPRHRPGEPIMFSNDWTGDRYQLTITTVLDGIVAGYVLLPAPNGVQGARKLREGSPKTIASRETP